MIRLLPVLLFVSCAPSRHLVIPPSAEAGACRRECMALANQCLTMEAQRRTEPLNRYTKDMAERARCDDQEVDCLETCPGAHWESSAQAAANSEGAWCDDDQQCVGQLLCRGGRCVKP